MFCFGCALRLVTEKAEYAPKAKATTLNITGKFFIKFLFAN